MRARRFQPAFDRLDIRLVLDGGTGGVVAGNGGSGMVAVSAPVDPAGSDGSELIPDPGLFGNVGGPDTGGSMIPDPGLLG